MKKVLERTKKRVLAVLISAGVILGSLAAYTVAAADEGELTNLALGMPVTASDSMATDYDGGKYYGPERVTDGVKTLEDDQSFWGVNAGKDVGSWLKIDLLTPQTVDSLKIDYRRVNIGNGIYRTFYTPQNITVQVSNTGNDGDWKTVVNKSNNIPADWADVAATTVFDYQYKLPDNTTARYVRVLFEDGGDSDGIVQISEIEVNGYGSQRVNLTLNKTAEASSCAEEGWTADKAIDGVLSKASGWSSGIKAYTYEGDAYKAEMDQVEEWLSIDLGALCELDDAVISYKREAVTDTIDRFRAVPKYITIQVKEKLADEWKNIVVRSDNVPVSWSYTTQSDLGLRTYALNGVSARYVRVLANGSSDDGIRGVQLTEVMVYGTGGAKPEVTGALSLTGVSATRQSLKKAVVKFTSNMPGTVYYAVAVAGANEPTVDTSGAGTAIIKGANTLEISNLSGSGAKEIYIVAKNEDGEVSNTVKVPIDAVSIKMISKGMTTKASSELDVNLGSNKVNDSIGIKDTDQNFWSTAIGQSINSWWQIDLDKAQELAEIRVEYRRVDLGNGNTRYRFVPKTVTIQVSNNGTDWQTVISKSDSVPAIYSDIPKSQEDIYTYSLDGVSGRYLRLLFEDGTQDLDEDAVQLMEVSVYATDYSGIPGTGENTNVNYAALALLLSSVTVAGILIYKKLVV